MRKLNLLLIILLSITTILYTILQNYLPPSKNETHEITKKKTYSNKKRKEKFKPLRISSEFLEAEEIRKLRGGNQEESSSEIEDPIPTCPEGEYLDTDSGKCKPNNTCKEGEVFDEVQGKCIESNPCKGGYFKGNKCHECYKKFSNCETCNENECLECFPNRKLSENKCVEFTAKYYVSFNILIKTSKDTISIYDIYGKNFKKEVGTTISITINGLFYKSFRNLEEVINLKDFFSEETQGEKELNVTLDITGEEATIKKLDNLFNGCSSIVSAEVLSSNLQELESVESMFNGCSSLQKVDFGELKSDKMNNFRYMFFGCNNLKTIKNSEGLTTANAEFSSDIYEGMFEGCDSLDEEQKNKIIKNMGCPEGYELENMSCVSVKNFMTELIIMAVLFAIVFSGCLIVLYLFYRKKKNMVKNSDLRRYEKENMVTGIDPNVTYVKESETNIQTLDGLK